MGWICARRFVQHLAKDERYTKQNQGPGRSFLLTLRAHGDRLLSSALASTTDGDRISTIVLAFCFAADGDPEDSIMFDFCVMTQGDPTVRVVFDLSVKADGHCSCSLGFCPMSEAKRFQALGLCTSAKCNGVVS
jgi:hypothetical protein